MALDPSASLLVRVRQSLGADGLLAALNEAQHCAKMAYSKINAKAETMVGTDVGNLRNNRPELIEPT